MKGHFGARGFRPGHSLRALAWMGIRASGISLLGGCGTLINLAGGTPRPAPEPPYVTQRTEIYGGLQVDYAMAERSSEAEGEPLLNVLGGLFVLDLPLSLVLDTLTLPYTLPVVLLRQTKTVGEVPFPP